MASHWSRIKKNLQVKTFQNSFILELRIKKCWGYTKHSLVYVSRNPKVLTFERIWAFCGWKWQAYEVFDKDQHMF